MYIPCSMKVGKVRYPIKVASYSPLCYGKVQYFGTITLYRRNTLGDVSPARMREALWHELTHAILFEMGNDLHNDEKFVSTFARHLSKAIDSARF